MIANQVIPRCESTNLLAKELAEAGYPHGTWIASEEQTHGRGRLGNQWSSSQGNLHLSLLSRSTQNLTWTPLMSALGVCRALSESKIKIKWPNDLWVDRKKVGGILCESAGSQSRAYTIIGIGVNVAHSPSLPPEETPAISLKEAGVSVDLDHFRGKLIEEVFQLITELEKGHIQELKTEYLRHSLFQQGDAVTWTQSQTSFQGEVLGLGDYGELRVQQNGVETKLFSEVVRAVRSRSI